MQNSKQKIQLFLISLLVVANLLQAQELSEFNPVTVPSPNMASLGVFDNVPISLFSGTVNVNVPLYTIKYKNISIPLSLNYHGAGVRPEELPGWVGLNWSLSAGGQITRTVNGGIPDEADINFKNGNPGEIQDAYDPSGFNGRGFLYSYPLLAKDDWSEFNDVYLSPNSNELHPNYLYDREPDEFSFNINGISGKFYLNHKGKWVVKCNQPIKVEFDKTTDTSIINTHHKDFASSCISKFVLVDGNGIRYTFGGNDEAIEYTRPGAESGYKFKTATTWNITQIYHPASGENINFFYVRGNVIPYYGYNFSARGASVSNYDGGFFEWFTEYTCSGVNSSGSFNCRVIEPSYLKYIATKNEKILFYSSQVEDLAVKPPTDLLQKNLSNEMNSGKGYDDFKKLSLAVANSGSANIDYNKYPSQYNSIAPKYAWNEEHTRRKKLNKIVIYPSDCNVYPSWDYYPEFENEKFSGAFRIIDFIYEESPTKRQQLLSVKTYANYHDPLEVIYKYEFSYYDHANVELPDYGRYKIDHWGYYNEALSLLSEITINDYDDYESLREPTTKLEVLTEGMLKKITYPTGGTSTFIYGQHEYSKYLKRIPGTGIAKYFTTNIDVEAEVSNIKVGGLRIDTIVIEPGDGTSSITKTYTYKDNYANNGTVSSGMLMYKPKYLWDSEVNMYNDGDSDYSFFSTHSLLPLSVSGTHIGYSEVTEKILSENSGYTVYKYTLPKKGIHKYNDGIPIMGYQNTLITPILDMSHERGHIESNEIYNNNNEIQEATYYYYNSNDNRFYENVRSRNIEDLTLCGDAAAFVKYGSAILHYTYNFYIDSIKNIKYKYGNSIIEQTTKYSYNKDNLLASKTFKNSLGEEIVTKYKYPLDYELELEQKKEILATESGHLDATLLIGHDQQISITIKNFTCSSPDAIFDLEIKETDGSIIFNRAFGGISSFSVYLLQGSYDIRIVPIYSYGLSYNIFGEIDYKAELSAFGEVDIPTQAICGLIFQNNFSTPIETIELKNNKIIGGTLNIYNTYNASESVLERGYLPAKTLTLELDSPLDMDIETFKSKVKITQPDLLEHFDFVYNSNYSEYIIFDEYSNSNDLLQYHKNNDISTSYIWGYNNTQPIAKIENALFTDVSCLAGEEEAGYGNWGYNIDNTTGCFVTQSGKKVYKILDDYDVYGCYLVKSNLSASKKYKISFMAYTAVGKSISIAGQTISTNGTWEWKTIEFSGRTSVFIIGTSTPAYIYNVRLFPSDAQMSTYTYDPLFGMTSETDSNGKTTYYVYDTFGRLYQIKDQDGNILKQYEYNYAH